MILLLLNIIATSISEKFGNFLCAKMWGGHVCPLWAATASVASIKRNIKTHLNISSSVVSSVSL